MGTRSVIATAQGDGWKGRYCHWDGYPSGVGSQLLTMHRQTFDGDVEKMLKVLTEDHFYWSILDVENGPDLTEIYVGDPRWIAVEGVGIAGNEQQASAEEWIEHDGDSWGTEWAYVLTTAGLTVLEGTYENGREGWKHRGMMRWDDPDAERKMKGLG